VNIITHPFSSKNKLIQFFLAADIIAFQIRNVNDVT